MVYSLVAGLVLTTRFKNHSLEHRMREWVAPAPMMVAVKVCNCPFVYCRYILQ